MQGLVVAAVVASAVGGVGYAVHRYNNGLREDGRVEVRKEWTAVENQRAEQLAKAKQKAVDDTRTLQDKADLQRKESDEHINTLNGNLRRAIDSLRERPARPNNTSSGGVPAPAAVESGCTGASLFRPDGEFLAREAARADRLRVDLETCQAQYNAASEALK